MVLEWRQRRPAVGLWRLGLIRKPLVGLQKNCFINIVASIMPKYTYLRSIALKEFQEGKKLRKMII